MAANIGTFESVWPENIRLKQMLTFTKNYVQNYTKNQLTLSVRSIKIKIENIT